MATVVAAAALSAVHLDGGVADLARHVRRAVIEPAIHHDPAADAGSDGDPDGVPRAARRAAPRFAERGAVGVVVERGGDPEPVVDDVAEREIDPAEVGREQHQAAGAVEGPRRADAHPQHLGVGLLEVELRDGRAGHAQQPLHHGIGALLGAGGLGAEAEQHRAVFRHRAGDEIGPSDVNPQREPHVSSPRLA